MAIGETGTHSSFDLGGYSSRRMATVIRSRGAAGRGTRAPPGKGELGASPGKAELGSSGQGGAAPTSGKERWAPQANPCAPSGVREVRHRRRRPPAWVQPWGAGEPRGQ